MLFKAVVLAVALVVETIAVVVVVVVVVDMVVGGFVEDEIVLSVHFLLHSGSFKHSLLKKGRYSYKQQWNIINTFIHKLKDRFTVVRVLKK